MGKGKNNPKTDNNSLFFSGTLGVFSCGETVI